MKATFIVLTLVVLGLGSMAHAQLPFTACLWDGSFVLTTEENGGTPLPDGTPVQIYWDRNLNGPDAADGLVPVCDHPFDCSTGPVGTYNQNTFAMNGTAYGLGAGRFWMDPCFVCPFIFPDPAHYYLKVLGPNIVWTSAVFVCVPGPQEIQIVSWTVSPPPVQTCNPPSTETYLPLPNAYFSPHSCLCLDPAAPGGIHTIYVGPVWDQQCTSLHPNGIDPPITITPGCDECGGPACLPASGWQFNGHLDWTTIGGFRYYIGQIIMPAGSQAGCACITLLSDNNGEIDDCWLPVSFGAFAAVAMDNAVKLSWNTLSETGLIRFEVLRDGAVLHTENATNTSTEHRYEFVDGSARNGLAYSYQLVAVNQDGGRQILATQSAAPTSSHASITEYALHQNYPNPFNPTTSIAADLVESGNVSLKVYNLMGQEVASLVNGNLGAGRHVVTFDASHLSSGIYLYRLSVNGFTAEKKMLLMK